MALYLGAYQISAIFISPNPLFSTSVLLTTNYINKIIKNKKKLPNYLKNVVLEFQEKNMNNPGDIQVHSKYSTHMGISVETDMPKIISPP